MLLGFNRYMVECELIHILFYLQILPRFNRYMVECECRYEISALFSFRVLIDTWWNVNSFSKRKRTRHISFNRYMVECEL